MNTLARRDFITALLLTAVSAPRFFGLAPVRICRIEHRSVWERRFDRLGYYLDQA
jgi:hypothetical protein